MAGGGGGGHAPLPKQEELQPHPAKEQLPNIAYCITSPPPWRELSCLFYFFWFIHITFLIVIFCCNIIIFPLYHVTGFLSLWCVGLSFTSDIHFLVINFCLKLASISFPSCPLLITVLFYTSFTNSYP